MKRAGLQEKSSLEVEGSVEYNGVASARRSFLLGSGEGEGGGGDVTSCQLDWVSARRNSENTCQKTRDFRREQSSLV
jgi:hypothetical protein